MNPSEAKRTEIISVAIKQFQHFGITKTTMNDIAKLIPLSKASLYYYFPDKQELILSVIHKVLEDYYTEMKHAYNPDTPLLVTLQRNIVIRNKHFFKHFMLHISRELPKSVDPDLFSSRITSLHEFENKFFARIFQNSYQKREISYMNHERCASLYILAILGTTASCYDEIGNNFSLSAGVKKKLISDQQEMATIFFNGIRWPRQKER